MAYKISGDARRKLKKEFMELRSYVDTFWYYYQMEIDMHLMYGQPADNRWFMTRKQAEVEFQKAQNELKAIEQALAEEI